MKTRRFRLTKPAKILSLILIIAVVIGGVFAGVKTGVVKTSGSGVIGSLKNGKTGKVKADKNGNVINTDKKNKDTINLSLDEWIGWKPIIDANGGLSTQKGSIYDKAGINVNISIINDATQSSNAMVSNKLDAAGYTINRVAFLSEKFKKANMDVIMPYITNFSNGGDGIIAKSNINSVNDLVNAKIGVPEFSEAHSLIVWFVNQSDLSEKDKKTIIDNLVMFSTPDEAAKAFFAGQVDVAATWEPYLTQAQNMSDAHILFSTKSSSSLIMDGILFNKDFTEKYPETVSKFIDGALEASDLYTTDLTTIKSVMPMFSTASDDDIKSNCESAKLTTYADNMKLFDSTAKTIYKDMCGVWKSIGEDVNEGLIDTLFDKTYMDSLSTKYDANDYTTTDANVKVDSNNEKEVIDTEALLKKSTTVNFCANTAKFLDTGDATSKLDEFINIAKVLDGSIIQIEGNIATDNASQDGINLSKQRAETVKQYFVLNGISADRIVTVGNGGSKPVAPNDTEENMQKNRRTDISFKCVE